jgi:hypothetical protein
VSQTVAKIYLQPWPEDDDRLAREARTRRPMPQLWDSCERLDAGDETALDDLRVAAWAIAESVYHHWCPPEWSHQSKMLNVKRYICDLALTARTKGFSYSVTDQLDCFYDRFFRIAFGIPLTASRKRARHIARARVREGFAPKVPRATPPHLLARPRERRDGSDADPRGPPEPEDDEPPDDLERPDVAPGRPGGLSLLRRAA